jgi:uncharacterized membrane protein (DUF485 family)
MMRDQTTTDEIAQIERELEILRSRQASLARWYRITMIYLAITFPVIAALTLAIIYTWNIDVVVGAFIFGMAVIVAGLIWIIGPPCQFRRINRSLRNFSRSHLGIPARTTKAMRRLSTT